MPALLRAIRVLLGFALAVWTADAQAAAPIALDLEPLLGSGSPAVDGWMSSQVRIQNLTGDVVRGTLSVEAEVAWARGNAGPHNGTDLPFSVAPRAQVTLEVPVHGFPGNVPSLTARAVAADGSLLAEVKGGELRTHDPLIFDLSSPSHVAPAVRALAVPLSNTRWGGLAAPLMSMSSARVDARTGEPLVPHLASGYAATTVVLASAAQLALIGEEARAALSDWLLAGGALALVLERPEDLRAAYVEAWAGGNVVEEAAPSDLLGEAVFAQPVDPAVPSGRPIGIGEVRLAPSADSKARLRSYRGGNLRPTPWGAAASYGLGELHLLAFRPNAEPFVSDPWTHRKLADLARHAWDRGTTVALPFAEQTLDESRLREVRKQLDPNEGTRWMIVVSAVLLLGYAGIAGPLNFYLARRSGKPLRALLRLPALSAVALVVVVTLGAVGRGVTGRARRLTLIEAGSGMGRAAATRFRGLYAASAREHTVQASARGNVLDVVGEAEQTGRRLIVDRDGARLTSLRVRPWEVVLVQESGFMNLGGGVSLLESDSGSITIKNRLGRDLVGVVLKPAGSRSARFFIRIKDGEAVAEEAGQLAAIGAAGSLGRSGLNLGMLETQLDSCSRGASSAWDAIEAATTRNIDFWPSDVPVLIGQLDGGEGKQQDSGFPLEADRTLLRVVGFGGVP